jgi:hypothetical protein
VAFLEEMNIILGIELLSVDRRFKPENVTVHFLIVSPILGVEHGYLNFFSSGPHD